MALPHEAWNTKPLQLPGNFLGLTLKRSNRAQRKRRKKPISKHSIPSASCWAGALLLGLFIL